MGSTVEQIADKAKDKIEDIEEAVDQHKALA